MQEVTDRVAISNQHTQQLQVMNSRITNLQEIRDMGAGAIDDPGNNNSAGKFYERF
jgi:hypothetical protein